MTAIQRGVLLARTAANLEPSQVTARLRLRAQRSLYKQSPAVGRWLHPARDLRVAGWPADFTPLDAEDQSGRPSAEDNARGTFRLLNQTRDLGRPVAWDQPDAPQLWRYELHYYEWAWDFVRQADRDHHADAFMHLWLDWRKSTTVGVWDAWSPYVVAIRAWVLCGVFSALVEGGPHARLFVRELSRYLSYLTANLETDVGGNHLIKNLKALIGLGVFFDLPNVVGGAVDRLETQVETQVLADGGHFERSPSYHCQALSDLIDISGLLGATHQGPSTWLINAVTSMTRWLAAMPVADGELPRFNDTSPVGSRLARLRPSPATNADLTVLAASGYMVLRRDGRVTLVGDVGAPCPPTLPAHAHADCLSFELYVDGRAAVVNSGTSTYEPSARRRWERSTAAHSTVEVDGIDQTEVWGTFRAARLATATLEGAWVHGEEVVAVGSHDGYRRLAGAPHHRRTWRLGQSALRVIDEVSGTGRHRITARLYLLDPPSGPSPVAVRTSAGVTTTHECQIAVGFNEFVRGRVVATTVERELPVTLITEIDLSAVLAGVPPDEITEVR